MHIWFSLNDRWSQYRIVVTIRIFVSIAIGYRYVSSVSTPTTSKWGTFVEATLQKPNFLPYVTAQDSDKFYQSLLFQWCVYPSFSGVSVLFDNDLCTVNTDDFQTFTVTTNEWATWSDGTPVTINDVYFTYKSIIKDNYRNIPHLDGYSNLQITSEGNELKFIFPRASRDNLIFFTNFILPAHILANISLEEYMIRFLQDPIWSTCVRLQTTGKDLDNYVFDLSSCQDFSLKNYQIKWFKDNALMQEYIQNNNQIIDFSLDQLPEEIYTPTPVLLNSYLTFFFNTTRTSRTARQRQWISALIKDIYATSTGLQDVFVQDPYLFTTPDIPLEEIKKRLLPKQEPLVNTWTTIQPLPERINLSSIPEADILYTVTTPIEEKISFFVDLPKSYTRISVTPNNGKEYFPVSYDPTKNTFQYNLSIVYSTIVQWANIYVVKGYEGETVINEWTITVWYLDTPPAPEPVEPPPATLDEPFVIVYFEDPISNALITAWKQYLQTHEGSDWFVFQWYTDPNSLEGKLTTKEYDIALRTINFWLKKDLSTLLTTENPIINPSLQKNEPLSNLITTYFLTDNDEQKGKLQQQIQDLHRQNPQLMILGKAYGKVWTKANGGINYPEKLYVLGWRKWVLQKIQLFQHINIDRTKVRDLNYFFWFLKEWIGGK